MATKEKPFYIHRLSIENFMGIDTLVIDGADFTEITGRNATGKTSVKEAFETVMSPEFKNDLTMIKIGQDEARLAVCLKNITNGNTIDLERIQRREGVNKQKMTFTDDKGSENITKIKAALSKITGDNLLMFEPLEFFRGDKAEDDRRRRQMLIQMIDARLDREALEKHLTAIGCNIKLINFDDLKFDANALDVMESIKEQILNRRTLQYQNVQMIKGSIEKERREIPETFDADKFKDYDLNARLTDLTEAKSKVQENANKGSKLETNRLRRDGNKERRNKILAEIEAKQAELTKLEGEYEEIVNEGKRLREEVDNFVDPGVAEIQAEINTFNTNQEIVLKIKAIKTRTGELETAEDAHKELDVLYKTMDSKLQKTILSDPSIKLPVEGLSFDKDNVFYNGVAFSKLNTAKKAKIAVGIGKKAPGQTALLIFDGFEALVGEDRTAVMNEMREANAEGYQFVTMRAVSPITDPVCDCWEFDKKRRVWLSKDDSTVEWENGTKCPVCDKPSKVIDAADLKIKSDGKVNGEKKPAGSDPAELALFMMLEKTAPTTIFWDERRQETVLYDDIKKAIGECFGSGVYFDTPDGMKCYGKGGPDPSFWYNVKGSPNRQKPTITGLPLTLKTIKVLQLAPMDT